MKDARDQAIEDLCETIARAEKHMIVTHIWVPDNQVEEAQRQFPGLIVLGIEPVNARAK